MNTVLTLDPTMAALQQKLDTLTEQVAFLTEEARQQRQRRQEMDDLKRDLTPILNRVVALSTEELSTIESDVQLEDVLELGKRLLKNTRNLNQLLDQLESGLSLWQELNPISQAAFLSLTNRLAELEQKGYFVFLQGGLDITDRIVTAFDEDDVRQLGENIVLILQTIKEMTQPEIMNFMHNTVAAVKDEEPVDMSLLSIIRQLNDPAVKRGLAKTLNVLKSVSDN